MNQSQSPQAPPPGQFELLIKPAGSACNLDCSYCFYLEKKHLLPRQASLRMTDSVLERLVRQYIEARTGPEVAFAWQGGEPLLMGLPYFRRAIHLQQQFARGRRIRNTIQTNGTLLDDEWGAFLADNHFLVGISVDGPPDLHDPCRTDRLGRPTHAAVMRGLKILQKHGVEFNTLTALNSFNTGDPLKTYQFLKDCGSRYWQFIPVVERLPAEKKGSIRHLLAPPPGSREHPPHAGVTAWSVDPVQYGEFLIAIFDRWVREDVGKIFVQLFDAALGSWLRVESSLCIFAETCGRGPVIEHNGDVFACDHYVYAPYRLGSIAETPLNQLVQDPMLEEFGRHKSASLPGHCRQCDVRFACHGECPKNRFQQTPDGEPGLNYICPAYEHFFHHVDPCMRVLASLLLAGQHAARIMAMLAGMTEAGRPTGGTPG
jgi:uncharacterized protein